jgi:septum formation protein
MRLAQPNAQSNPPSLILASSSPRRQELLEGLGLTFRVHPSDASEIVDKYDTPAEYVEILSKRKASQVAALYRDHPNPCYVIGSDTVVVIDGDILGKPQDEQDAFDMLSRLQGRSHAVYTGLCLIHAQTSEIQLGHSKTEVRIRSLTQDQIYRYIQTKEPFGKAGAYAIQGFGGALVDHIHGDYYTVVGLPLWLLGVFLDRVGYPWMNSRSLHQG